MPSLSLAVYYYVFKSSHLCISCAGVVKQRCSFLFAGVEALPQGQFVSSSFKCFYLFIIPNVIIIGFIIIIIIIICVPTKQIRDFSTFKASNVSRLTPSTRCVTAANKICRSLDVFSKHAISIEDTFSFA
jgi:hypothetical protein